MGVSYVPKNKKCTEYPMLNFSGADLIGFVFRDLGLPVVRQMAIPGDDFESYRIMDEVSSKKDCIRMSERLAFKLDKATTKPIIENIIKKYKLWDGTADDLIEWLRTLWVPFLRDCHGYKYL